MQRLKSLSISDRFSSACILLLIAIVTSYSGVLNRLDYVLYDLGQKFSSRAAPHDVVIVAIDEDSLAKLGRWPWPRDLHAGLVTQLKKDGAKAIGLDLIFSEPDATNLSADAKLAAAIKKAGNVVLPVLIENVRANGQLIETLPLTEFAEGSADLGRVHVELDTDGIARGVYLWEGLAAPDWPLFAQSLLKVAGMLPETQSSQNPLLKEKLAPEEIKPYALIRQDYRGLSFVGPPGSFQSVSYAQVLAGEFPLGLFKDKIVLVGATAAGMGDLLPTPVSGLSQPMAGVEFHANVLQTMRQNKFIQTINPNISMAICALVALLPMLWLPRVSPLTGLLVSAVMLMLVTAVAIALPWLIGRWLPPTGALFALLVAYPVWSWRKLESANRFLDGELKLMQHDLAASGANLEKELKHSDDPFQSRILQVQTASEQLRQMQMHRRETLAFISHDIRAPLASAILQLNEQIDANQQLKGSLSRALNLAEDFLQTSRAEMINTARFQEIELGGVMHQAADDAFSLARAQSVTIVREIQDEPVWLKGEFGLLHRAILNLLVNAIKHAPANSSVILRLQTQNAFAIINVIDQGQGISPEQQLKLFKRFNRVETNETVPEGSGLGLYFVRTVTEKHGGEVSVESEQSVSTCFSIKLPIQDGVAI